MEYIQMVYTNHCSKKFFTLSFFFISTLICSISAQNQTTSSWSEPNEKDDYHGFIVIPENVSPGYVKVSLTQNNKDLKPAMVISRDLNKSGAIISGSSAQTNDTFNRTAYFSVHPGMSYSVRVYPFFNAKTKDYPVSYTLAWEFVEKPDLYEPNDSQNQAKPIDLNQPIEAYAIAGHINQYYVRSNDENTYDWYKLTLDNDEKIQARILNQPSDLELNLRLFTGSGRQIGVEITNQNPRAIETRSELPKGTYYLEVHPRMKGPRKSENDTKPIPDHFNKSYELIVMDSRGSINNTSSNNPVVSNRTNIPNDSGDSTRIQNPSNNILNVDLKDLEGTWVRKASNLSHYDGLEIEVKGNQGVLVKKAESGFQNGDVKWAEIKKIGASEFEHNELATNGQYYPASISFIAKDVIEIRIIADGSGTKQTWVRKGGTENSPANMNLASIQGTWMLTQSNNSGYEGMLVNLEGTSGIIVSDDNAKNYKKGGVKWKDLTKVLDNEFAYSDLDDNGNSIISMIRILNADKLEIRLGSSVDGNQQTWQRVDDNTLNNQIITAEKLPCSIYNDTRLVNTAREVDYYVDCVLDVTASLTIDPGVVIDFGKDAGMAIYDQGNLKMIGTDVEKIIFKGKEPIQGYWRGIHTETSTEMEHAEIKHAGSNYVYCCNGVGAVLFKKGTLSIKNSYIHTNKGCGVFIEQGVPDYDFASQDNVFANNEKGATCSNNVKDLWGSINTDTVLKNGPSDIDYFVFRNKQVYVTAKLEIEPGVVIVFDEGSSMVIGETGSLISNGTMNEKVILRGKDIKRDGYWKGIQVESDITLKSTNIYNAGSEKIDSDGQQAAVYMKKGELDITDSSILLSGGCGISLDVESTLSDTSGGNTITSNQKGDICREPKILSSTIFQETVLKNGPLKVDYIVPKGHNLQVKALLTIEPGVVIEFAEDAVMSIVENGKLICKSETSKGVKFVGKKRSPNYWKGIHIETKGNLMQNVVIESAGDSNEYNTRTRAAITVRKGHLEISNSHISENTGCHIAVGHEGYLKQFRNTFSYDIGAVCYIPAPLPKNIDIATTLRNTERDIDYYVPKEQLTDVYDTLIIDPGVRIEFLENSGLRMMQGLDGRSRLIAEGTENDRIVFNGNHWKGIFSETFTSLKKVDFNRGGSSEFPYSRVKAGLVASEGTLVLENCMFYAQTECAVYVDLGVDFSEYRTGYLYGANTKACVNNPILPRKISSPVVLTNTERAVDYVVPTNQVTDVLAELTIEPGVVIEFEGGSGLGVYKGGKLIAEGTQEQRITFTGSEKKSGHWRGIHIESDGNKMKHFDISSAGSNYIYCCNDKAAIFLKSGYLDISNSYIHDNSGCGIYVEKDATLAENFNTFAANQDGHICN